MNQFSRLANIDSKPLILPLPQHPGLFSTIRGSVLTKPESATYDQAVNRWVEGVQNVLRSALRWPEFEIWQAQLDGLAKAQTDITNIVNSFAITLPLTTRGDLLTRNATTNIRLPLGTSLSVLSSDGTDAVWKSLTVGDIANRSALTRVDDTNITLTLGGSPTSALFEPVSLTLGWTGQLSLARGGTGANLVDPNADRMLFWDDSLGQVTWLQTGSGISIAGDIISSTGSGGTVTSVAMTVPGELSVSGSPITTSGTLALTWLTQTQNKVFASPNGSTGVPTFRALVAADHGVGAADSSRLLRGDLVWSNSLIGPMAVGSSGAGPVARLDVLGAPYTGFGPSITARFVNDIAAFSTQPKAGISLDVIYTGSTTFPICSIEAQKANAIDGDAGGLLRFFTCAAAPTPVERMKIDNAGLVSIASLTASTLLRADASKVLSLVTIGSGLSFDGTTLSATGSGGTVTSVALTMPTGFSVSGSPISGAGTLAVTTALNGILKGNGSAFGTVTIGSGLTYDGTTLAATGGSGEANTASNVGSLGVGHWKQKTSLDLEFYKTLGAEGIAFANVGSDYNRVKLDIDGLTEDTTPDVNADFVATYDASAAGHKKVKLSNLVPTVIPLFAEATAIAGTTGVDGNVSSHTIGANTVGVDDGRLEFRIAGSKTTTDATVRLLFDGTEFAAFGTADYDHWVAEGEIWRIDDSNWKGWAKFIAIDNSGVPAATAVLLYPVTGVTAGDWTTDLDFEVYQDVSGSGFITQHTFAMDYVPKP